MSWEGSNRRERLPSNWRSEIRPRILRRDKYCACPGCPKCSAGIKMGCHLASTEVDHLIAGDDHSDLNLGGKCTPCHRWKTGAERERVTRRRPTGKHPGLV